MRIPLGSISITRIAVTQGQLGDILKVPDGIIRRNSKLCKCKREITKKDNVNEWTKAADGLQCGRY